MVLINTRVIALQTSTTRVSGMLQLRMRFSHEKAMVIAPSAIGPETTLSPGFSPSPFSRRRVLTYIRHNEMLVIRRNSQNIRDLVHFKFITYEKWRHGVIFELSITARFCKWLPQTAAESIFLIEIYTFGKCQKCISHLYIVVNRIEWTRLCAVLAQQSMYLLHITAKSDGTQLLVQMRI